MCCDSQARAGHVMLSAGLAVHIEQSPRKARPRYTRTANGQPIRNSHAVEAASYAAGETCTCEGQCREDQGNKAARHPAVLLRLVRHNLDNEQQVRTIGGKQTESAPSERAFGRRAEPRPPRRSWPQTACPWTSQRSVIAVSSVERRQITQAAYRDQVHGGIATRDALPEQQT